jgi:carbon monoxide dehydrogenase subunit G
MSSTFETSVHIIRPVDEVFAYVADPARFPDWNSAVESVTAAGARFVMRRRLPNGPATNELEIIARQPPTTFEIRTVSGPTPFVYRYRFEATENGTLVTLAAEVQVAGLVARLVRRGVDANLATLRSILERS